MTKARDLSQVPNASLGFKNRIINGDCRIDQRNAGASVTITTNNTYTIDRWTAYTAQASKYSIQQNAGSVTPPVGFTNYLGCTSLSAYSVTSSDYFFFRQVIEGLNVADLGWGTANAQPVTLSFWVRSSLTGTFGGSIRNGNSDRSYPFSYTVSSANTFEYKTITIPGDTTGTWATNNTAGLQVSYSLGAGSTFSGTAGAWAAGSYIQPTGATSVVGTNGATFYITGVQLEKGSTATSFDYRPYGTELQLCQRYFERIDSALGGIVSVGQAYDTGAIFVPISFKATKRAAPTFSTTGTWVGLNASGNGAGGSLSLNLGETNFARLTLSGASGLVAGNASGIFASTTASLQFSSEL
jgi:hypothetical protein